MQRGSIRMDQNAEFAEDIYLTVKSLLSFQAEFSGMVVAIVLDNAPDHSQTEARMPGHDDCVLLRLSPYSPFTILLRVPSAC
ncbi:hypothetical protein H310_01226 [Aphanomyces invadans]|uniref:Tc1-like transposase DDE domain-containing protein n=1 Tax=Aphanomyces invadans TaxID=157072 RepID=A0A024UQX0_9STRA|nr:hypothetical protein H310_01226 [Aphanomyces invadans]ETW08699.1 hypothetical protein H310_01226 [Aphanomyces invadans]|eukprot:XP_008862504.1 hypothetical protein H310_01226 [Aphanomyces invadans]